MEERMFELDDRIGEFGAVSDRYGATPSNTRYCQDSIGVNNCPNKQKICISPRMVRLAGIEPTTLGFGGQEN
jgi:hypothetical protein